MPYSLISVNPKEHNVNCNEIEKKHMEEFAMMGTLFNGPELYMAKTQLANYGAGRMISYRNNPTVWNKIGWAKD